jgi:hypothetical protein
MKSFRWLPVLLICAAPATAADLSKIDRTIAREPTYQAKPKYCLLVFGQDAKTRVWLVLDGDLLYVDRDASGDLTGDDKKVRRGKSHGEVPGNFVCGDLGPANGKTIGKALCVSGSADEGDVWVSIHLDGKYQQSAGADANGFLQFADSPGQAPIVHFDGPLTMTLAPTQEITRSYTRVKKGDKVEGVLTTTARAILPTLVRGSDRGELKVAVGSLGQGKGTFARMHHSSAVNGVHPIAEFEFPNRDPEKGTIKVKRALAEQC